MVPEIIQGNVKSLVTLVKNTLRRGYNESANENLRISIGNEVNFVVKNDLDQILQENLDRTMSTKTSLNDYHVFDKT